MIACEATEERGLTTISGDVPNGHLTVTREAAGVSPITLRNGSLDIITGGFLLQDSEGPIGIPLTYRATVTPTNRVIQRNLMLTPNFMHGLQGWVGGSGRTAVTDTSTLSHHATIGKFPDNAAGGSLAAPPALIGHVESADYVSGSYTLTPPTGGGTAITTNDWVYLIHHQNATAAAPATPSGFTLVTSATTAPGTGQRVFIWRRKRVGGDTGYTVAAPSGAESLGTCLWVRSASDDVPVISPVATVGVSTVQTLTTGYVTTPNPALVLTVAAVRKAANGAVVVTGNVTGSTFQYQQGTTGDPRSTVIATTSQTDAGTSSPASIIYSGQLTAGVAWQLGIGNTTAITNRVIAKAKAAALPVASEPYRFTGRFRFTSTDVWLWSDVAAQGTWGNLKATKATWQAVRSASAPGSGDYARLFVAVVNPADGSYYIPPVQVLGFSDTKSGQWLDYSFYFTPGADIPTTAEIWFMHGSTIREYTATWWFDDLGITAGAEWLHHDALYYIDGDITPKPPGAAAALEMSSDWQTDADDSTIAWSGTVGNSTSVWTAPSTMWTKTICQINAPFVDIEHCGPVLLSDPVASVKSIWCGLLGIDALTHPSAEQVYAILGRSSSVAVSQVRGWEVGRITVMTNTLADRTLMVNVMQPGRVLLMRNPDMNYPENNWYLAIGDVSETRIHSDARKPLRSWGIPFVRVERPAGLIEGSTGTTWADVAAIGTWLTVKTTYGSWLELMTAGVP